MEAALCFDRFWYSIQSLPKHLIHVHEHTVYPWPNVIQIHFYNKNTLNKNIEAEIGKTIKQNRNKLRLRKMNQDFTVSDTQQVEKYNKTPFIYALQG